MNERLQQLASQAGHFEFNKWDHFDIEKFAELIVRECSEVAAKVGEGYVKMGYTVPLECSIKIKEHFGIE